MSLINKMNSRKHPIHLTLLFCGLYLNASCFGAEHLDHELSVAAGIASPYFKTPRDLFLKIRRP